MDSHDDGDALPVGDLIGSYRIEKVLGQGGFGITYLAKHDKLETRIVAIKEYFAEGIARRRPDKQVVALNAKRADDFEWGLKGISQEADTLVKLEDADHPNIVKVYDIILGVNGTAYIVMQFVPGEQLEKCVSEYGLPSPAQVDRIAQQLFDGGEIIHGLGIIHRDITPKNILMRPKKKKHPEDSPWDNLTPVLIDFGASRKLSAQSSSGLTRMVADGYSPKEQYRGDNQTEATDIYSLAATLYFLVTGQAPEPAIARSSGRLPIPADRASQFDPRFINAMFKGLELDIAKRPATIADWRKAFPIAPTGGRTETSPVSNPFTRRNLLIGGGVLAAAAAATGLGIALTHKGLNTGVKPLTLGWTRSIGPLSSEPFGQIAATKSGPVIAAHTKTADGDRMLAVRLDNTGAPAGSWQDGAPGGHGHAILPLPDGGAYVGGTVMDGSASSDGDGKAVVVRLDANWHAVWRQEINDGAVRALLDLDGTLIAGLETRGNKAPLIALDSNGKPKWKRDMSKGADEKIERIIKLSTGNLAVLGSSIDSTEDGSGNRFAANSSWVAIVDNEGNTINRADLRGLGSAFPLAIVEAAGRVYASGFTSDGGRTSKTRLFVWALSLTGASLWKSWNYDMPTNGLALATDGKGRLYVAGHRDEPYKMWLAQLNDQGELPWQDAKSYGDSGDTSINGLSLLEPGKGFAMAAHTATNGDAELLVTGIGF